MGGVFPGCQLNLTKKKKKTSRGEKQPRFSENWFPVRMRPNKLGLDPDVFFSPFRDHIDLVFHGFLQRTSKVSRLQHQNWLQFPLIEAVT